MALPNESRVSTNFHSKILLGSPGLATTAGLSPSRPAPYTLTKPSLVRTVQTSPPEVPRSIRANSPSVLGRNRVTPASPGSISTRSSAPAKINVSRSAAPSPLTSPYRGIPADVFLEICGTLIDQPAPNGPFPLPLL